MTDVTSAGADAQVGRSRSAPPLMTYVISLSAICTAFSAAPFSN